jgi:hypothetical protein
MVAFFSERVDIELDGELQDRPLTPWSPHWPGPRSEGPARRVGLSTVEIPTSELHHRHTVAADGGRRAI